MDETKPVTMSGASGFGPGEVLDLGSQDILRRFRQYVANIVVNDDEQKAYDICKIFLRGIKYRTDLFQHPTQLSTAYEQLLNLSRGVALSVLSEDDLKTFFQKGIVTALRNQDIDLASKVDARMAKIMFLEDRDALKKKLRFELRQNFERLTMQPIKTSIGVIAPTVKEWLGIAEGQGEKEEPLTVQVLESQQFQLLSQNEQDVVGKLLALDDLLSISSDSNEGFENIITIVDEQGQRFVLDHGEMRPAHDPESDEILKKMKEINAPDDTAKVGRIQHAVHVTQASYKDDDEARYALQEKLIIEAGSDTKKVVSKLRDALPAHEHDAVVVPLFVLARYGALEAAIEDEQIRNKFAEEYIATLADTVKVSHDLAFALITKNASAPTTIAAFLYWALQKATGGDEKESARIGNQLGSIIAALGKSEYVRMTFFDVKTASFRWTPVRLNQDGSLSWKE